MAMSRSRESIFRQLKKSGGSISVSMNRPSPQRMRWGEEEKIARLSEQLLAAHAEVHRLTAVSWMEWVNDYLSECGLKRVVVGGPFAEQLQKEVSDEVELRRYQQPIESWKGELFEKVDVSITSARGGIASSGSLVLWPDRTEPRLMSLVPPVHIALLKASTIYESFEQMVVDEDWAAGMPTNVLLISGPSKTADIQQVLAYGVHGPKQLIVLILEDK